MQIRYSLSILPMLLVTSTLVGHAPAVSAEPVYACASRHFGFMRLVKSPNKCRRRERLVTFPGASGDGGVDGNAKQQVRIDALEAANKELRLDVRNLQDANAALTGQIDALQQANAALNTAVGELEAASAALTAQMDGATGESNSVLPDKIACISELSTAKDLIFEGCNVHVRNGLGFTDSKDGDIGVGRGTGNLIIGYDEDAIGDKDRTGSHNLVVGGEHTYSSYGGLVAGHMNSVTAANASVTGGSLNVASGPNSSVTGGWNNQAQSNLSSISGGAGNQTAMANYASVSGGINNVAAGEGASVSGGFNNMAFGTHSSVLGGEDQSAMGEKESIPPIPAP